MVIYQRKTHSHKVYTLVLIWQMLQLSYSRIVGVEVLTGNGYLRERRQDNNKAKWAPKNAQDLESTKNITEGGKKIGCYKKSSGFENEVLSMGQGIIDTEHDDSSKNNSTRNSSALFFLGLQKVNNNSDEQIKSPLVPLCLLLFTQNRNAREEQLGGLAKRSVDNNPFNIDFVTTEILKILPALISNLKTNNGTPKFERSVNHPKDLRNRSKKIDSVITPNRTLDSIKHNVLIEANQTLNNILHLEKSGPTYMPDELKKPLVAILFNKLSNIYNEARKFELLG